MSVEISRTCTIDMGHRVPNHDGKCSAIHGHTYKIEIFATGPLQDKGSSEGMVVDYSYLKELLLYIDDLFDHGFVMWDNDEPLRELLGFEQHLIGNQPFARLVKNDPFGGAFQHVFKKLGVMRDIPTAENLASLWLQKMQDKIAYDCLDGKQTIALKLTRIKVWETPNSCCEVRSDG